MCAYLHVRFYFDFYTVSFFVSTLSIFNFHFGFNLSIYGDGHFIFAIARAFIPTPINNCVYSLLHVQCVRSAFKNHM